MFNDPLAEKISILFILAQFYSGQIETKSEEGLWPQQMFGSDSYDEFVSMAEH